MHDRFQKLASQPLEKLFKNAHSDSTAPESQQGRGSNGHEERNPGFGERDQWDRAAKNAHDCRGLRVRAERLLNTGRGRSPGAGGEGEVSAQRRFAAPQPPAPAFPGARRPERARRRRSPRLRPRRLTAHRAPRPSAPSPRAAASLTREPCRRRSNASSSSSTSPNTSSSRHRSTAGLSSSSARRFRCRSRLSSSAATAIAAAAALGRAGGFRWDEGAALRGGPPGPAAALRSGFFRLLRSSLAPALRSGLARLLRSGGIVGLEKKRRRSRGASLRVRRRGAFAAAAEAPRGRKEPARPART